MKKIIKIFFILVYFLLSFAINAANAQPVVQCKCQIASQSEKIAINSEEKEFYYFASSQTGAQLAQSRHDNHYLNSIGFIDFKNLSSNKTKNSLLAYNFSNSAYLETLKFSHQTRAP